MQERKLVRILIVFFFLFSMAPVLFLISELSDRNVFICPNWTQNSSWNKRSFLLGGISLLCIPGACFISLLIMWMFYFNFHKQTFALDSVKEPWSIMRAHSSTTDTVNGRIYKVKRHILFKQGNKGCKGSGHWKGHCLSVRGWGVEFMKQKSGQPELSQMALPPDKVRRCVWPRWEPGLGGK